MADFDMAMVDEIRRRLDASYEEALLGLQESGGDLLRALAAVERRRRERQDTVDGGELIGRAVALARSGELGGLEVKLGDKLVRRLALPKSQAGALLGAVAAVLLGQLSVDVLSCEPEAEVTAEVEQVTEAG